MKYMMLIADSEDGMPQSTEDERRAAWLIEERRKAPDQGETAVRRAQVQGEPGLAGEAGDTRRTRAITQPRADRSLPSRRAQVSPPTMTA